MSLFDDASLVYIPTGYKPTKNYSGKPSTGGADMTFSRASGATRVNSRGLVEKVRTNLLLQSNSFDTTWSSSSTTETSGQAGYDGTNDAWLLDKSAASGNITQNISASGVNTFSVYVKGGTDTWCALLAAGPNVGKYFNLSTGAVGSNFVGAPLYAKIEAVGGEWYRVSMTISGSITQVRIYPADGDGDISGTSGNIYIQDAQLETGDIATNYIETTSAAVSVGPVNDEPRLTYNPVNPTAPSLLMEPQRTNLALYSEQFDNAAWSQTRGTITANAIASPDGYTNADLWAQNTGETTAAALLQNISVTSGTAYSLSVFAKKQNKNFLGIRANSVSSIPSYFDLENGTLGDINPLHTAKIEDYGNGWYRCSISYTTNSTIAGHIFYPTDGSSLTVTDSGGIYLFGAMHEAGSYGTSYIPTLGAAVTRLADAASKTGISSLIGQTEGTLYVEFSTQPEGNYDSRISISDVTTNNWVFLGKDGPVYRAYVKGSGSVAYSNTSEGILDSGIVKMAIAYKNNDIAYYFNGTQRLSSNSISFSGTLDSLIFGNNFNIGAVEESMKINQALLFPTRLDNATLATLTSL
jgi:hypothetical protein